MERDVPFCPLSMCVPPQQITVSESECTKQQCAWWDANAACCVVVSIHNDLQKISKNK